MLCIHITKHVIYHYSQKEHQSKNFFYAKLNPKDFRNRRQVKIIYILICMHQWELVNPEDCFVHISIIFQGQWINRKKVTLNVIYSLNTRPNTIIIWFYNSKFDSGDVLFKIIKKINGTICKTCIILFTFLVFLHFKLQTISITFSWKI